MELSIDDDLSYDQSIGDFTYKLDEIDNLAEHDEYPLAWRIEPEFAYQALSYFFENNGERTPFVDWQED